METTLTSKTQLSRVLGLAGALFEEHRHQFIYSHLDEVSMIENQLNTLLDSIKAERREYELWLDNRGEHEEGYDKLNAHMSQHVSGWLRSIKS